MTRTPVVSVITPFYNPGPYFEEAIQSVLTQTYTDWELMLVDDGSTDGSTEIAKRYAEAHPGRIVYIEHEGHQNRGRSTSRNVGIRRAQGTYIAFLDADDVYHPQKLAKQFPLLEAHPETGMVYGSTEYWYSWTGRKRDWWRDRRALLGVKADSIYNPPDLLTLFLKRGGVVPCTCGVLVRRELAVAVGGFDESFQHLFEDLAFVAKLCVGAPVYVEGGCWARYRQHPESTCQGAIRSGAYHPIRLNPARLRYLTWLGAYLRRHGVRDPLLWRAYNHALSLYERPRRATIEAALAYAMRLAGIAFGTSRRLFAARMSADSE